VSAIIGSEWETKRLPPTTWAKLLDGLADLGLTPVLHGAPSEVGLAEAVKAASKDASRYRFEVGCTIPEALALLAASSVAVGGDTGLVHAARALGVPTVACFGPTDPARHSWEPSSKVLVRGLPCQPCHHHGPKVCPLGHHDCLRTLEADTVREAVLEKVGA
jgi:ADP-heptose:LPS heptosyltransferase